MSIQCVTNEMVVTVQLGFRVKSVEMITCKYRATVSVNICKAPVTRETMIRLLVPRLKQTIYSTKILQESGLGGRNMIIRF